MVGEEGDGGQPTFQNLAATATEGEMSPLSLPVLRVSGGPAARHSREPTLIDDAHLPSTLQDGAGHTNRARPRPSLSTLIDNANVPGTLPALPLQGAAGRSKSGMQASLSLSDLRRASPSSKPARSKATQPPPSALPNGKQHRRLSASTSLPELDYYMPRDSIHHTVISTPASGSGAPPPKPRFLQPGGRAQKSSATVGAEELGATTSRLPVDRSEWFDSAFAILGSEPRKGSAVQTERPTRSSAAQPPTHAVATLPPREYAPLLSSKEPRPAGAILTALLRKPDVVRAAADYDSRHSELKTRAVKIHSQFYEQPVDCATKDKFDSAVLQLWRTRYFALQSDEWADAVRSRRAKVTGVINTGDGLVYRHAVCADSAKHGANATKDSRSMRSRGPKKAAAGPGAKRIWAPRALWCDARMLLDTDKVYQQRFDVDFERAIEQCSLVRVVLRCDDGDPEEDEDLDGIPDEVEDVCRVLGAAHAQLCLIFAYYGALKVCVRARLPSACATSERARADRMCTQPDGDFSGLTLNEWTQFICDHRLASSRSRFCKPRDCDTLFYAVDALASRYWKERSRAGGIPPSSSRASQGVCGGGDRDCKRHLSRVEFLGALVHLAIKKWRPHGEWRTFDRACARAARSAAMLMRLHGPTDCQLSAVFTTSSPSCDHPTAPLPSGRRLTRES